MSTSVLTAYAGTWAAPQQKTAANFAACQRMSWADWQCKRTRDSVEAAPPFPHLSIQQHRLPHFLQSLQGIVCMHEARPGILKIDAFLADVVPPPLHPLCATPEATILCIQRRDPHKPIVALINTAQHDTSWSLRGLVRATATSFLLNRKGEMEQEPMKINMIGT